jgi:hypothetical protein
VVCVGVDRLLDPLQVSCDLFLVLLLVLDVPFLDLDLDTLLDGVLDPHGQLGTLFDNILNQILTMSNLGHQLLAQSFKIKHFLM